MPKPSPPRCQPEPAMPEKPDDHGPRTHTKYLKRINWFVEQIFKRQHKQATGSQVSELNIRVTGMKIAIDDRLSRVEQWQIDNANALLAIAGAQAAQGDALREILSRLPPLDATSFRLQAFTQPINPEGEPSTSPGDTHMIDTSTLTPLEPGTPVGTGKRAIIGVTNNPPGSRISGLTASSDNSPQPLVDTSDQQTNYILCDPPADMSVDSVITVGDPDGSPSGSITIDWDGGVAVDNATGFTFALFTQPMTVTPPASAKRTFRK